MKRAYKIFSVCAVFSILIGSLFFSVSADTGYNGVPYSKPYMPVCSYYPTSEQLPFSDCVVVYYKDIYYYYWWFIDKSDVSTQQSNSLEPIRPVWGWFIDSKGFNSNYYRLVCYSASPIIQVKTQISTGNTDVTTRGELTPWPSDGSYPTSAAQLRYKLLLNSVIGSSNNALNAPIATESYSYEGASLDYYIDKDENYTGQGSWSVDDYKTLYYIAQYPSSVSQAVESIQGNTDLLNQYYTSLNGKLNSLSSDHIALYNQNNELLSQVDELQSQLSSQSGEYQSALDQAQSEIQSNVNSAASQAADDVNNAGEDISDINTNVDDVNSIVSKLQEWLQVLRGFSDNLEDTEENVIDALESGKSLINQFFGVCPPIVIAVFGFALTFLVVRKIIGR